MLNSTRFEELFAQSRPWQKEGNLSPSQIREGKETLKVGSYCSIRGRGDTPFPYQSMSVAPTEELLAWIRANMLIFEDTLFFEILVGGDGLCSVFVKYNKILGSRRLTDSLRVETLPEWVKRD